MTLRVMCPKHHVEGYVSILRNQACTLQHPGFLHVLHGSNPRTQCYFGRADSDVCKAILAGATQGPVIVLPFWSEAETAYIAGILDGEGSMGVYKWRPLSKVNQIVVKLSIINTNKQLIEWLSRMFGLGVVFDQTTGPNRKPVYSVHPGGSRAYQIISRVKPFLIVKKKQASLLLGYWEWRHSIGHKGNKGFSPEELEKIRCFVQQTHILNHRGL